MSPLDRHQQSHTPPEQPERITKFLSGLIEDLGPDNAVARQYVASTQEQVLTPDDRPDPIGDAAHSPIKGIIHRYPDRALLMPTTACAAYCRFCFRREVVGQTPAALTPDELNAALDYIRATPGLWEVILSGGDPLMLSAENLADILNALDAIPHVQTVRVHTRLPVQYPSRLRDTHIEAMAHMDTPVWVVMHVNHADELAPAAEERIRALKKAGIPLLSQTVLLKGVNDDVDTMETLFRRLSALRVKPYYLHHCDPAPGNAHFRAPLDDGRAIMRALKARLSGLALPKYVLDTNEGVGKYPIEFKDA